MTYFEMVGELLLRNAPELAGWLVGMVLAALMVRRGGGRAEKLLLAGCCLMAFTKLANPFLIAWLSVMVREGWRNFQTASYGQGPAVVLSLAGFVCLVWGFWLRFWPGRRGTAS